MMCYIVHDSKKNTKRIQNRKNISGETPRSFLAMLNTFDSKYKEKLVNTDHEEKEISQSEEIPNHIQIMCQQEINKKRENILRNTKRLSNYLNSKKNVNIILMIQNKCLDVCNKIREKITYEEDAIYESCKYS